MVRLKNAQWTFLDPTGSMVRDLTPDSPGPAFNLTKQSGWRAQVEPHLDGREHSYMIVLHFDAAVKDKSGNVVAFDVEKSSTVRFKSDAAEWKHFSADFYEAIRNYIGTIRNANAARKRYGGGGLRGLKRR